jgi:hypothetical protein
MRKATLENLKKGQRLIKRGDKKLLKRDSRKMWILKACVCKEISSFFHRRKK